MKFGFLLAGVSAFSAQVFAEKSIDESVQLTGKEVVINTWVPNGFANATKNAWDYLSTNHTALDAIEHGCNWCEEL